MSLTIVLATIAIAGSAIAAPMPITTWSDINVPGAVSFENIKACQANPFTADVYRPLTEGVRLDKVVFVHRHGDRLPISQSFPADASHVEWSLCEDPTENIQQIYSEGMKSQVIVKKNIHIDSGVAVERGYWKGNCVSGQLTRKGHEQLFHLGQHLHDVYFNSRASGVEWQSTPKMSAEDIRVRSTDIWRTQESVQSLLNGLVSKNKKLKSPPRFDLKVVPSEIDPFAVSLINYQIVDKVNAEIKNDPVYQAFQAHAGEYLAQLRAKTTYDLSVYNWVDGMLPRYCNAKPLPCNPNDSSLCITTDEFARLYQLSEWDFYYRFAKDNAGFAKSKMAVREMFPEMFREANAADGYNDLDEATGKFNIFSAHDTTLMALLGAYRSPDATWQGYSANLAFEFYSPSVKNRTKSVRILLNGQPLKLPFCAENASNLCTYEEFATYTRSIGEFVL